MVDQKPAFTEIEGDLMIMPFDDKGEVKIVSD